MELEFKLSVQLDTTLSDEEKEILREHIESKVEDLRLEGALSQPVEHVSGNEDDPTSVTAISLSMV